MTPMQPFTLRTLEEIEGIMSGVARSIEAIDNGTYGHCEQCAVAISKASMAENPLATRCDAHVVRERPALFVEADVAASAASAAVSEAPPASAVIDVQELEELETVEEIEELGAVEDTEVAADFEEFDDGEFMDDAEVEVE
jgi:hypothetical protein